MSLPARYVVIRYCFIALLVTLLPSGRSALAQEVNALAQCREQSLELDQIHNCLDQYLDVLDSNMETMNGFLEQSLSGVALTGLGLSQQAFIEYRQQNCLWYLDFSSPRADAEQIAKNCLASMTQDRLQELQGLVSAGDDTDDNMVEGFYVYGSDRNSFQPCGSNTRYFVEGDQGAVNFLQQSYLAQATSDRQLLYAMVLGALDDEESSVPGYQGVLALTNLIELRVPTDLDCSLPNPPQNVLITDEDIDVPESAIEVFDDEQQAPDEPEQQLIAYFGDWTVDCTESSGLKTCALGVDLRSPGAEASADEICRV